MQNKSTEQLLDQMHVAILAADFATLGLLVPILEASLTGLEPPDLARLQDISRKATRNAACLQAALRGVRAAQHRLADLRQNASGLVTYTDAGKRAKYAAPGALAQRL